MQYTTVLFDLDGTLTKSEEGITKTAIYAAEKMGFTGFTQEQFKVFIGPPLYDSFRKVVGMTEEQVRKAGIRYHVGRYRYSYIATGMAMGYEDGDGDNGMVKLLLDERLGGGVLAGGAAVIAGVLVTHRASSRTAARTAD